MTGGGGGGGGSRPDCQKAALTTFFFSPQLILVLQWFINGLFQENYNVPRFRRGSHIFQGVGVGGGGVKHIPRGGSNFFQGGGGV